MSTIYIPQKRIYAPNDPFFAEGNIALRAIWLKKEAQSELEIQIIQQEASQLSKERICTIYCDECRVIYPSITAYESHYEAVHRNVCLECQKIFPGFEWLQLHIDEFHNTLLQIKKERGDKIHKCYVEDCKKVFADARKRRLHLVDKHNYPRHFPFDLVYTGTLSFEERKIRDQKNKARIQRHNMEKRDVDMSKNEESVAKDNGKGDVDMDELVTNMSRLKIPKSISFGHVKSSVPHHRQHHHHHEKLKPTTTKKDDIEMKEKKVYSHPRKRGPKKKKQQEQQMMEE